LDHSNNAATNSLQKCEILAAASLAAIWVGHQADSLFKFLESTVVFHGNMPSEEKGIHVAEIAHDLASLDTAIMHAVQDVKSGADLSSSNLAATQEARDHDSVAPASMNQASYGSGGAAEGSAAYLSASAPVNNDHVAASHLAMANVDDSVAAPSYPQPVAPANIAPAIPVANQLMSAPQSSAPNSAIVATTEAAVQLAISDTPSSSIQPIVLANGPVPLNLALDQVPAQVGFGPVLPQNATAPDPTQSTASAASSVQSASSSAASISHIMHTVEVFIQNTPSYEIAVSGSNVVIVDAKLSDASSPNFGVLTWDFNGSTLSIVGIIPHHHAEATA
jgi:hypothetical protein